MSLKDKKRTYLKKVGQICQPSTEEITEKDISEMESFRGYIEYVIYPQGFLEADELLWVSLSVKNPMTKEKIRVSGETTHHSIGDYLEFYGEWKTLKDGQKVFDFKYALRVDDDYVGATSMLAYLFNSKARKIITVYEDNPIEAMNIFKCSKEVFTDSIKNVKGIGPKSIEKAYEKYKTSVSLEKLYFKFQSFGLQLSKAMKLVKCFGSKANDIMDDNVYSLINIDGFGFETVDRLGLQYYKFDREDGRRIEAYIIQLLRDNCMNGDCFMYLEGSEGIIQKSQRGLMVSDTLIRERIIELIETKKIIQTIKKDKIVIYLPHIFKAEKNVAQMISSSVRKNRFVKEKNVDKMIGDYEKMKGFKLADKQKEGIKTSAINQFSIISGPPGSGKTTLIDCICYIFQNSKKNCKIKLAALAGKAATRMSESTGLEASTIHRLLGYNPDTGFRYNEVHPLPDVDLLIIDEFSMVDIKLFESLLKAISINTVVILVGDKDQLPSVDCGQVLEDLIQVSYIPKTILEEIYRQADGSTTLPRALNFNIDNKVPDLSEAHDFHFIEMSTLDSLKIQEKIKEIYLDKVKKWGIENVCLLEPQKKGALGTDNMNLILQEVLNPHNDSKNEIVISKKKYFREGDRVIQIKNRAEDNIFNGMVGTIVECTPSKKRNRAEDKLTIMFDDKIEHVYTREEFDDIKLAYALTVHKTQGSEYKSVIFLVDYSHKFMIRKRLVYTGWTRNKDELCFIGQKEMIGHALINKEKIRNTKLTDYLLEYEVI